MVGDVGDRLSLSRSPVAVPRMPAPPTDPPSSPDGDPDEDLEAFSSDAPAPATAAEALAAVEAFVESETAQAVARGQVSAKVPRATPEATIEELAQDALVVALEKAATLQDVTKVRPWVAAIARNVVRAWRRSGKAEQRRLSRKAELEIQLQAAREEDAVRDEGFLLSEWIQLRAQGNARDLETIAMLLDRARSGEGYAEIAAAKGTTEKAIAKRVQYLRDKYLPLLERDRAAARRAERSRTLLWLAAALAVLAAAVALYLLLRRPPPPTMGPDLQAPPSAPPVETLSPPVFEPAQPTGPDTPATPDKPRR